MAWQYVAYSSTILNSTQRTSTRNAVSMDDVSGMNAALTYLFADGALPLEDLLKHDGKLVEILAR